MCFVLNPRMRIRNGCELYSDGHVHKMQKGELHQRRRTCEYYILTNREGRRVSRIRLEGPEQERPTKDNNKHVSPKCE